MRRRPTTVTPENAEALAYEALGFFAQDMPVLSRFFAVTGLDPGALRDAAASPGLARAVLEFLSADESLLLAFCADHGHDPGVIAGALAALGHRPWERDFA